MDNAHLSRAINLLTDQSDALRRVVERATRGLAFSQAEISRLNGFECESLYYFRAKVDAYQAILDAAEL